MFKSDSLTKNLPLFSRSSFEEPESILVAQWDELDIQVVTFEPKNQDSVGLTSFHNKDTISIFPNIPHSGKSLFQVRSPLLKPNERKYFAY